MTCLESLLPAGEGQDEGRFCAAWPSPRPSPAGSGGIKIRTILATEPVKVKREIKKFAVALLTSLLIASATFSPASADEKKSGRVPTPAFKINTDKGDKCVEPEAVMLRDHMKFILHQRDKTVHDGVRTAKYSLKNCVDCHADAKTGSVLGKEGFCSSCHVYASVKIDCFECHSALREANVRTGDAPPSSTVRALSAAQKPVGSFKGNHP